MTNKFEIIVGDDTRKCEVKLNGERLNGVCRVSFDLVGGSPSFTTIRLDIMGEIIVKGQFEEEAILQARQPLHVARSDLPRRENPE
jgi:hypothetical protein